MKHSTYYKVVCTSIYCKCSLEASYIKYGTLMLSTTNENTEESDV